MTLTAKPPFTALLTQTFAKSARYYPFSLTGENEQHKGFMQDDPRKPTRGITCLLYH